MQKGIYKKLVGVAAISAVLYSTGVLNVLGGFWRTLTPGLFDQPSSANTYSYGYGYGDNGWGYGYGYGYGYNFGYGYGTGLTNADPYYAQGFMTNGSGVTLSAGTSVSTGSTTFSGNGTTISSSFGSLLGTTVGTIYETVLNSSAEAVIETPVTVGGKTVTISIPSGLKVYTTGAASFNITTTGASVSNSSIGSTISSVLSALEVGDSRYVLMFNQPVRVVIANVGTSVNTLAFKLSGKTAWTTRTVGSTSCTPSVGGECAYLSGSDLVINTYHFTQFAAAIDTPSNGGSNGGGSGGGGSGGGGSGGGSYTSTPTTSTGVVVSSGELANFDNAVTQLVKNNEITTGTVTLNGQTVTILTPKFKSAAAQAAAEKITAKVLAEITKRKIKGADLTTLINSYNNFLAAVKLYTENGDQNAKKIAQYYLQQFAGVLSSYPVITGSDTLKDEEFEFALSFLKRNGLTKYSDVDEYRPNDAITREEASKFFVEFATKVLGKTVNTGANCEFTDTANADSTLKDYIVKACQLSLMKGSNEKFMPSEKVTKAQALTVLVRAIVGTSLDETVSPWYKNYFEKSQQLGLTKESNVMSIDKPLSRYEAGLLIYRSADKKGDVTVNK